MSTNSLKATSHSIYPAYTFPAAPTFNKWVHLTAADVQALRQEPLFQGQNIYFHLNHPIEFVYIIGPVVAIDHIVTQYNTRFTLLEIDDGSGTTIEAKISYKPDPKKEEDVKSAVNPANDDSAQDSDLSDNEPDQIDESSVPPKPSESLKSHPLLTTRVFQTTVDNLSVISGPRGTDLFLSNPKQPGTKPTRIDVGTVLKAKGTLQRWRNAYQLALSRAFLVTSLDEEVQAWNDYSDFATRVLSTPWVLSSQQIKQLEQQQLRDAEEHRRQQARSEQRQREKARKRQARDEKYARYEQRVEKRLALEAAADGLDGNPLDHPDWKPAPAPDATEPLQLPSISRSAAPSRENIAWNHEFTDEAALERPGGQASGAVLAGTQVVQSAARSNKTAAPHYTTMRWQHELEDEHQPEHQRQRPTVSAAPRPETVRWQHEFDS